MMTDTLTPTRQSPSPAPLSSTTKIFLAGHRGLVGSAIGHRLEVEGFSNIVTRRHAELDLIDPQAVNAFFAQEWPEYVVLAAAKVGGVHANSTYPAEFLYQNLMIEANVIHAAYVHGVTRLLFLGSSCIYPRLAEQPMPEEALLTGTLEPTNEPYAIAKITGIKLCESYNRQYGTHYRSVMPTNLYGPNDNFDLQNSHVIPALLRKFHEAKMRGADFVRVWGTGKARREFLYVEDMADACVFLMQLPDAVLAENTEPMLSHINIGTGQDVTIQQLAGLVREVVGFEGYIVFDMSKPEGVPRKLLDTSLISALGWRPKISLREGLEATYRWFVEHEVGS
jgi:GDP-L-fucose synthase